MTAYAWEYLPELHSLALRVALRNRHLCPARSRACCVLAALVALAGFAPENLAQLPADVGKADPDFTPWVDAAPPGDLAYGYPKTFVVLEGGGIITAPMSGLSASLRKLFSNGRPDSSFTPSSFAGDLMQVGNPPPEILAMARQPVSGKIIVGGQFSATPFSPLIHLARYNSDGTPDVVQPLPTLDGPVHALLIQPDGKILVGGSFTLVGSEARVNLARLNEDGSLDVTAPPAVGLAGSNIRSFAGQSVEGTDYVLIAGSFTTVGGSPRPGGVARLRLSDLTMDANFTLKTPRPPMCDIDSDGEFDDPCPPALVPPYNPSTAVPHMVAVQPDGGAGKILVAGLLPPVNAGSPILNLYRFDATGLQDTSFTPAIMAPIGAANQINHLTVQQDGKIVIGGSFASIGGSLRRCIARLHANGTLDAAFNPRIGVGGAVPFVEEIALLDNGDVLIGGSFDAVNLVPNPAKLGLGMARLYGDSVTPPAESTLTVNFDYLGELSAGAFNRVAINAAGYGLINCIGPAECSGNYRAGDLVQLQATPAGGWRLKSWTINGVLGGNMTPLTLPPLGAGANFVKATFEPIIPQYRVLITTLSAGGQVKVESVPTSFGLPTLLGQSSLGTPFDRWLVNQYPSFYLRLTAVSPGYVPTWGGSVDAGGGSTRNILGLTANHDITVNFTAKPHAVVVNVQGLGKVTSAVEGFTVPDCSGPTCEQLYGPDSTPVTLTAAATAGWEFDGWTDLEEEHADRLNPVRTVATAADAVKAVTASFVQRNRLTVGFTGSGSGAITTAALSAPGPAITCPSHPPGPMVCSGDYDFGTEVTLRAVANSDSVFFGWSGDGADVASGQRMVSMVGSKNVLAEFRRLYQFLPGIIGPVGLSGGRLGIVTFYPGVPAESVDWCASTGPDGTSRHCGGQFPEGTWVTLEVSPPPDTVVRWIWTGPVEDTLPPNANRKRVQITADNIPVMVSYVPQVSLEVNVVADAGGTVTSEPAGINSPTDHEELFDQAETVTLTAHPMPGWIVGSWAGGSDGLTQNQRVVTMTGPQVVTVTFVRLPPEITGFNPAVGPVLAGRSDLGLAVTANGVDLQYEWFKQPAGGTETSLGITTSAYLIPAADVVPVNEDTQYRVRVSNTGGEQFSAWWTLTLQRDHGDSPAPFPTLATANGARHVQWSPTDVTEVSLGRADSESDGQPSPNADGDGGDEAGVALSPLYQGQINNATLFPVGSGKLNAWIDFTGNGDWADTGEQVALNVGLTGPGPVTIPISVPANAKLGQQFARFRFSTTADLSFTGDAPDGEVEDHRVEIRRHPIVGLPPSLTVPKNFAPYSAPFPALYLPFQVDSGFNPPTVTVNSGAELFAPGQPAITQLVGTHQHELGLTLAIDAIGMANLTISVVPTAGGPPITAPFILHVADAPDADGIAADEENNIPVPGGTTGDGNGDGQPDGSQLQVASFESQTDGHYVTLAVPEGLRLVNVTAAAPPAGLPEGFAFAENTLIGFRIEGLAAPGQSVVVEEIFHAGLPAGVTFSKFGPAAPGEAPAYYPFPPYTGTSGDPGEFIGYQVTGNKVTLHLKDGLLGDADWIANGVIGDPGGPVLLAPSALPTLTIVALPGHQAQISWPASATGLVLKYADSLTTPITWTTDTNVVITAAGTNSVTVDISAGTRFYGLGQP